MLNITQVPLLITWFLSLRYITTLPEVYPQLSETKFLWITDLAEYDPTFVMPIIAAIVTALSLAYSPNLNKGNMSINMPFIVPYIKYLK